MLVIIQFPYWMSNYRNTSKAPFLQSATIAKRPEHVSGVMYQGKYRYFLSELNADAKLSIKGILSSAIFSSSIKFAPSCSRRL